MPQLLMLLPVIVFIPVVTLYAFYAVGERDNLVSAASARARAVVATAARLQQDTPPGTPMARIDRQPIWSIVTQMAAADGMAIMLVDKATVIAADHPEDVGRQFPGQPAFDAAARSGDAMLMTGIDGTTQILAAAPMPGAPHQFLLAAIPEARVLANTQARAWNILIGIALVGALMLAVAGFMARWSFLRPLDALLLAAKKLRAGDLKVRVESSAFSAPEFTELAGALNIAAMRLERNHRSLSERANRDGLTGLASRRRFDEQLAIEWRRARRAQTPLSVLMIDVDEFKTYNDRCGHLMGDDCLRQIGGALLGCLRRPSDMAARYGGEEIVILLPETDLDGASFMGARFLAAVRELGIAHRARPDGLLSVSIGVASMVPGEDEDPMPHLVRAADEALYTAKRQGRGRVVLATAETVPV